MNKKLLATLAISILALPAAAQGALQLPLRWHEAVQQKVDQVSFDRAMTTLNKSLVLQIPVTKQFFDRDSMEADIPTSETAQYRKLQNVHTYHSTTGCKAYVLDEHWVMAGGTCLWNGCHTIEFTDKSGKFATGLVEPNPAEKALYINGKAITWKDNLFIQPREHQAPHVILVRVPAAASTSLHLNSWPKINVLAFKTQSPLNLKGGQFYINTAHFGLNTNFKRNLLPNSVATMVTLQDNLGDLSGVSTDPLAYLKNNRLRWLGVNMGVTELRHNNLLGDWDGKPSNDYFTFTAQDAQFIKDTISKHDPAAWKRIEARKGLEIW